MWQLGGRIERNLSVSCHSSLGHFGPNCWVLKSNQFNFRLIFSLLGSVRWLFLVKLGWAGFSGSGQLCQLWLPLFSLAVELQKLELIDIQHFILSSFSLIMVLMWVWLWSAANNLEVDALFVYTKTGHMASLLSRCRPDCPIFAFTTTTSVRRRLNLQWGLIPFRLSFSNDMESNLNKTFSLLKARGMIKSGDLVIAVSDMLQSIQVMNVP